jgi:hypothetical protein
MMEAQNLIEQLKIVRRQKGYTYQQLADKTEAIGRAVSLSTIKRVFAADSDQYNFRYDTTLQPLAAVLLDSTDDAEADALRAIIEVKNAQIAQLEEGIATRDAEIANHQAVLKHKNRVEFCLSLSLACAGLVILLFYAAHSIYGW